MAMTYEDALRKVMSCLRLAKSSNPAEAALAASRAQEIMDRYQISMEATQAETPRATPDEPIQNFDRESVIDACQKDKQWVIQLVKVVGEANGCRTYFRDRNFGSASFLIGRPSDVQTARYLIGLLAEEVRRLGRENTKGYSVKYRRDFKYGVVIAIQNKFREQWNRTKQEVRAEQAANPLALVRVNQALVKMEDRLAAVKRWEEEQMEYKKSRSTYRASESAKEHGFRMGQTIEISRAKAGLKGASVGEVE